MTDEFVDFYEILELPLDAGRSEIRKRISELYVEAQRNLDHRNFNTRVRFQQLFEMTLPQARYILLDEGRRDDYDRMVAASRTSAGGPTPLTTDPQNASASGEERQSAPNGAPKPSSASGAAGRAPSIDALPQPELNPETVAREREELWNKWKSGLQSAMERENAKSSGPSAMAPRAKSERADAAPDGTLQSESRATATPHSRPKVKFDFEGEQEQARAQAQAKMGGAGVPSRQQIEELQEIELRRNAHRREITKRELINTSAKASAIGAALVLVPGLIIIVIFMSVNYPANQPTALPIKSAALMWMIWLTILCGLAYGCAHLLSKAMRRKQGIQLATLSYEELLRYTHKN